MPFRVYFCLGGVHVGMILGGNHLSRILDYKHIVLRGSVRPWQDVLTCRRNLAFFYDTPYVF
jgi:hypothetical protein